jgi:RNA polymerase sigma-70 factor (ECF subfamily)
MDQIDEAALLRRLRRGDEAAYELMVRTYGGRMQAVARGLLRHDEDARDCVQTAYVLAFKGLETFQGASQLSTWLHRIVVNTALMKLRSRRRKPEESIDALLPTYDEGGHHAQDFAEWAAQADRLLEVKEMRSTIRRAIERLPESYRTVLILRDIEEMTTEQVSRQLGVTPNAVKIRLHRARQALATVLRDEVDGNLGGRRDIKEVNSPVRVGEGGTPWHTRRPPRAIRLHSISP